VVVKEGVNFAGQHGDENVGTAVVVIILKNGSHTGERPAVGGERRARFQSTFGEGSIAVVVKEKLAHAVVGNEDVGESIVIVVREAHAQRAALDGRNPGRTADVFECAIAAVT